MNKNKIIITGTGRCGTTFLVRLFTFMGFNTGFSTNPEHPNNLKNLGNPGLENWSPCGASHGGILMSPAHAIKSPYLCEIKYLVPLLAENIELEMLVVPIRNSLEVAKSRNARAGDRGGFRWALPLIHYGQEDLDGDRISIEAAHCDAAMAEFKINVSLKEWPCIYLDFEKMTTDEDYLYDSLKVLIEKYDISKSKFNESYANATNLWVKGEF